MFLKKIDKLKRKISRLISALYDKPLAPPTNREKELIEELKITFLELTMLETTDCSTSEEKWINNTARLKELVINSNPREFLRWDVISKTMSVTYASYITTELKYLKSCFDWKSRWSKAIKESPVGHPIPHWQFPSSSGNLITHAYHLAKFEEKTAMHINTMNFVFEFGGGYGSMCRLLHNLGFQEKYVIFDLPAFSALQQFFLKSIGITVHSPDSFKTAKSGVVCISNLEQLKVILLNHIEPNNAMFIATWSLSESPLSLRNAILPLISTFKAFLIGYQERFGEVNNIEFFRNWTLTQNDIKWYDWQIEHIPNNNRYLIGKRK